MVVDCAAVDEEESGGDPEGKGKGRAETGEHGVVADVGAEGADVFDGGVAALGGGEGRGEDWGAGCWVGCGGV